MKLGLTDEQIAKRVNSIGGSDANTLMGGVEERILRLWSDKRGETQPEDLSDVLPVQMGSFTEPFNAYWFQKQTGMKPFDCGREMVDPRNPWRTCTLDGVIHADNDPLKRDEAVWEAKHVSAFAKSEEILERYYPQLTHNMTVCGLEKAYLSVFFGTFKWEMFEVSLDEGYAAELHAVEAGFWEDVQSGNRPRILSDPPRQVPIAEMREADMTGNNLWADLAADWTEYKVSAKRFNDAAKGLKEMIEPDVRVAHGHGVKITRAKNGNLTIRGAK